MLLYTRYYIALNIICRAHVWQKRTRTINIIAIYSTTHWQTLVISTLGANDNSHWFFRLLYTSTVLAIYKDNFGIWKCIFFRSQGSVQAAKMHLRSQAPNWPHDYQSHDPIDIIAILSLCSWPCFSLISVLNFHLL